MKKLFLFILIFISLKSFASNGFKVLVTNNSNINFKASVWLIQGVMTMNETSVKKGEKRDYIFEQSSTNAWSGVEGSINLCAEGDANKCCVIYYDNPFIGASSYNVYCNEVFHISVTGWSKSDHILEVEITGGYNVMQPPPKPVPVITNTKGSINGTIRWNKNDIQGPVKYPYSQVFRLKAYAPVQFFESDNIPVFSVGGTYNGKKGYYDGQKPVGNISYQLVNSMNPDYMEISYAVTDLPTEIPVFMDIQTDNSLSKWNPGPAKLNPPDQSYFFIVGTFPAFTNSNITISNDYVTRSGIDFNCDGDWLKVDANGNIVGGGGMVNKIAVRKTAPVLPGGILTAITVTKVANTGMMEPAAIKTNQVQNKQLPGAVQKARIRN